jgi:hypothetical protein
VRVAQDEGTPKPLANRVQVGARMENLMDEPRFAGMNTAANPAALISLA